MRKTSLQRSIVFALLGVLGGFLPPFYSSYVLADYTSPLPGEVSYNPQAVFDFMRNVSDVFRRYNQPLYFVGPERMECENYCDDFGIYTLGVSLSTLNPRAIDSVVGELIVVGSAFGFSVHLQGSYLFFHYAPIVR